MAILDVLIHPDPRLRKKSQKVEKVNDEFKKFLLDLTDTMYEKDGVGLAAPQVGVLKQVMVIDVSDHYVTGEKNPQYFVNPKIIEKQGKEINEEGCLSVPDIHEDVARFTYLKIEAMDENLNPFTLEAHGLLAIAIQHEMDHLNGKLFIDYLSPLKYQRITKKLKKYKKSLEKLK